MSESPVASPAIEAAPSLTQSQKILRNIGWAWLTLSAILIFTLFKLPETRLKNFILGNIQNALSSQGMTITAGHSSLSFGLGLTYSMENVVITPQPPDPPIKIDELEISPSVLPLLMGKLGARIYLKQADGVLKASFANKANDASLNFKADQVNLGRLGILAMLAGLHGSADVTGEGSVSGDLHMPSTWNGEIKLKLGKILLDQSQIQGFNLPAISISEGVIDLRIDKSNSKAHARQARKRERRYCRQRHGRGRTGQDPRHQ